MTRANSGISRRRFVATGGAIGAVGLAGCLDNIPFLGDGPMTFAASQAIVPDTVLDETEYEEQGVDDVVIEETFEAAGQSQDVEVTNWMAEYDRAVDFGPLGLLSDERYQAAVFVALATPQVDILGRTFNPVGDMSTTELAELVQDHYDDFSGMEQVDEEQATVAGQTVTVAEFEAEAELLPAGQTIDVTVHISEAAELGDDFIVAIGGYPTTLESEADRFFSMAAAIEHDE